LSAPVAVPVVAGAVESSHDCETFAGQLTVGSWASDTVTDWVAVAELP